MYIPNAPRPIISILTALDNAGFKAYLVGGCVRDMLMGRCPGDWDIATSALPEQVMAVFPGALPTGIKHGTVTVSAPGGKAEVTTFRTEGGYTDHRRPDFVRFDTDITGDLARRDFTCNAMAMPLSGDILDPFHGAEDIQRKLIRCVGDAEARFAEDALRMFRAVRFSAQLGFSIEPATLAAMGRCAQLCPDIAPERIAVELGKALLSAQPEKAALAVDCGLLEAFLSPGGRPDFSRLKGLPVKKHARWAGFCAGLGAAGRIDGAAALLRRLRLDSQTIQAVSAGLGYIAEHREPVTPLYLKRAIAETGESATFCAACGIFALTGQKAPDMLDDIIQSGCCVSIKQLAINGNDLQALGYSGPAIGKKLNELLLHVLEHPEENHRERLLALAQNQAPAI